MNPKWMMTDDERRVKMEERKRKKEEQRQRQKRVVAPFISHLGRAIFYKSPNLLYSKDEMQQV